MARFRHIALIVLLAMLGPALDAREGCGSEITLTLRWTAPGDDGWIGRAVAYDVRVSRLPITAENFSRAGKVAAYIVPGLPGTTESMVVAGLTPGVDYYFAIKAKDDSGNWSPISNVAVWANKTLHSEPVILPVEFSRPWPNPARSDARFTLTVPRDGPVRVEVFDVRGRRIQVLADGDEPAGSHNLTWNLAGSDGRPVSAGLYLVRAEVDDTVITRRISVVR